jgi:hypothetical protein
VVSIVVVYPNSSDTFYFLPIISQTREAKINRVKSEAATPLRKFILKTTLIFSNNYQVFIAVSYLFCTGEEKN